MKKYLFIFLLFGVCIADVVVLKNGQSFNGLLVGMKEHNILFKDENNKIVYLRTETIDHLGISNGEIIINDNSLNLSNYQKVNLLLSYNSYEEQKKLYDNYTAPENIVFAGCCFFIVSAIIISSSSSSKGSNDNSGSWGAFENFMNGFFND
tara:strand:+ start:341 stop:793 length:453 start_codon:yes stop_codon:yes gene_type:complete